MAFGGAPSFDSGGSNSPSIPALATTAWATLVPSFSAASTAKHRHHRGRRFMGGSCRNADNAARIIELRLNDGTTQTTFKQQTLEAGDTWRWTDEQDGLDLARLQAIEIRTTTTPTTALVAVANYLDG